MRAVAVIAVLLAGCGARTGLDEPDGDVTSPDGGAAPIAFDADPPPAAPDAGTDALEPPEATHPLRATWAGNLFTCAVAHDGSVWCWGSNTHGQLGTWEVAWSPDPLRVSGVEDATNVVGTCASTEDGAVFCWGDNSRGQLGDGTRDRREGAVRVHGIDDAVDLFVHDQTRCVARSTGRISCWGTPPESLATTFDRSATDDGLPWSEPRELAGWDDVAEVDRACVRRSSGEVECVGVTIEAPDPGRSPIPEPETRVAGPVRVATLDDAVELEGLCAVRASGAVVCWTLDLPTSTPLPATLDPEPVLGLSDVADFDGDPSDGCARRTDGRIVCWGEGAEGQLGNGERMASEVPVEVLGLADVRVLSRGSAHACAGLRAGGLWCWGRNHIGELGDRSILLPTRGARNSTVPVRVVGLP